MPASMLLARQGLSTGGARVREPDVGEIAKQ